MNIGDTIKDFSLPSTEKKGVFNLSEAAGSIVVLYFYPKDDTPGCTLESHDFSNMLADFQKAGAMVFGVSRDTILSHDKFRCKYDYAHHLIADTDEVLCQQFGVLGERTQFSKTYTRVIRSTFIIDANHRLAAEWRDIKEVAGHAQTVLAAVQNLAGGK